jgi:flagellar protein FlaG
MEIKVDPPVVNIPKNLDAAEIIKQRPDVDKSLAAQQETTKSKKINLETPLTRQAASRISENLARLVENQQRADSVSEIRDHVKSVIDALNEQMIERSRTLNFSVDQTTGKAIVTIRDLQSGEVIRQMPPEVLVNLAQNFESLKGLVFDDNF